jgi:hypothetical protein
MLCKTLILLLSAVLEEADSALKGLRANRCTIAPQLLRLRLYLGYEKWRALTSTTAAPRQWSPFRQGARPRLGHCPFSRLTTARPKREQWENFFLLNFCYNMLYLT